VKASRSVFFESRRKPEHMPIARNRRGSLLGLSLVINSG
jgi:hypothetical protein